MRSFAGKCWTVVSVAAALLLLSAGVASAHVTVSAPGVTEGASDAAITFRIPDESATANTVGVKVQLPTDHPIAGVLVAPVAGWTAKIINTKLATPIKTDDGDITEAVSEIDWAADAGGGVAPGFFGQFTIIAGQLPKGVSTLTFKAIQTYSDKTVVSWIEEAAPGSTAEPDHPAPELNLLPAAAGSSSAVLSGLDSGASSSAVRSSASGSGPAAAAATTATVTAAPAIAASNAASKGSVTLAIVIGIVGVLIGAAGVGLGLASRRRPVVR